MTWPTSDPEREAYRDWQYEVANGDTLRGFRDWLENAMVPETTYKIIRFQFEGQNRVIDTGLTLEQAQAHCQREDTHGDGWFDGYDEET